MNLDELSDEIRKTSSEKVVQDLSRFLIDWKGNEETAEELYKGVEKYIGNTWVAKNEGHKKIYQFWSNFRDAAITGIGGLTMNERLYWFSLFERYDDCATHEDKLIVYRKLHAKP